MREDGRRLVSVRVRVQVQTARDGEQPGVMRGTATAPVNRGAQRYLGGPGRVLSRRAGQRAVGHILLKLLFYNNV